MPSVHICISYLILDIYHSSELLKERVYLTNERKREMCEADVTLYVNPLAIYTLGSCELSRLRDSISKRVDKNVDVTVVVDDSAKSTVDVDVGRLKLEQAGYVKLGVRSHSDLCAWTLDVITYKHVEARKMILLAYNFRLPGTLNVGYVDFLNKLKGATL